MTAATIWPTVVSSRSPTMADQSMLIRSFVPNAAYARLWKWLFGIFLFAGLVGLLHHSWTIASDLRARRTWPTADGEIVSAEQRDDSDLSQRSGSLSQRTRYWVEYEVRFAVPEDRCRTGIIYTGANETMPCRGLVRTRSSQSSHDAFEWLTHSYHPQQPVKVLWDPSGAEIKIAGEPATLRFNFDRLAGNVFWVLIFGVLFIWVRNREEFLRTHPDEEIPLSETHSKDNQQLTSLDLQ